MSYLPIARKYRPQRFSEVVGQDVAVRVLENAIRSGRIGQAYLFSGIRGVGKTSIARILAKSLNCETGPTTAPCGVCIPCQEIVNGSSLDVVEIDGASHTGVDDVRSLQEGAAYAPQHGKYKVHIIDEVHMLSNSAFNALLKILEEPPAHVIFCFATTEVHKIPATVLSRCQHIALRRIPFATLLSSLEKICGSEEVSIDRESASRMARLADGSLRDALSLLDQAISLSDGKLTREFLDSWLGFSDRELLFRLLGAAVKADHGDLLHALTRLSESALDPERFLVEFLELLRHLILVRAGAKPVQLPDLSEAEYTALEALAGDTRHEALDWVYQMGMQGLRDLAQSPIPFYTLEILFLRFTHARSLTGEGIAEGREGPPVLSAPPLSPRSRGGEMHSKQGAPPTPRQYPETQILAQQEISPKQWTDFVAHLRREVPQIGNLLAHVGWRQEGDRLVLSSAEKSFYTDMLREKALQLGTVVEQFFGKKFKVEFVQKSEGGVEASVVDREREGQKKAEQEAKRSAESHPAIQTLREIFGGTIESVKPLTRKPL